MAPACSHNGAHSVQGQVLQPPRRPPPAPTCPGPLPGRPRPRPVTESSRHRVCLRACELPKLIVMVLSRAEGAGCFLACAVGFYKRSGGRKWVLFESSGSHERLLLFAGEKLGSLRGRLSPAAPKAVASLSASRLVVLTGETQQTPNERGVAAGEGARGLLPGASAGFISSGRRVWGRGVLPTEKRRCQH